MITDEELLAKLPELLSYDPGTGVITRLAKPATDQWARTWNTKYAGKPAFTTKHSAGYLAGEMFHRALLAHRVCFALAYGRWPVPCIDHVNGIKTDNRLINLRECSVAENNFNVRPKGKSGFKGVTAYEHGWRAGINVGGVRIHLGVFTTREPAARAYDAAARQHFGEFACLNFPDREARDAA